jgi:hypothetical protein
MIEDERDSPGFIWLCFVNWVNTLETAKNLWEKKVDNPQTAPMSNENK